MSLTLAAISRYPIKGLGPEALAQTTLNPAQGLPGDRRWALARSDTPLDPNAPCWLPKRAFVALDREPWLAALSLRRVGTREDESTVFEFARGGRVLLRADLASVDGRAGVETLVVEQAPDHALGRVTLVEGRGFAFCDAAQPLLSIISQASLNELGNTLGRTVEGTRFRANLVIAGGLPRQELDWVGAEIGIGAARLRVLEPIERCAATRANPRTGEADLDVLRPLARLTGEAVFGVYAEVLAGAVIACGERVTAPRGGRVPARSGLGMR